MDGVLKVQTTYLCNFSEALAGEEEEENTLAIRVRFGNLERDFVY